MNKPRIWWDGWLGMWVCGGPRDALHNWADDSPVRAYQLWFAKRGAV